MAGAWSGMLAGGSAGFVGAEMIATALACPPLAVAGTALVASAVCASYVYKRAGTAAWDACPHVAKVYDYTKAACHDFINIVSLNKATLFSNLSRLSPSSVPAFVERRYGY